MTDREAARLPAHHPQRPVASGGGWCFSPVIVGLFAPTSAMSDKRQSPRRQPSEEDDQGRVREWTRLSQLVVEFLGYLLVLGWVGWLLDDRYGWNGRGLFGGLMVGLGAWIYRVIRLTRDLFK